MLGFKLGQNNDAFHEIFQLITAVMEKLLKNELISRKFVLLCFIDI